MSKKDENKKYVSAEEAREYRERYNKEQGYSTEFQADLAGNWFFVIYSYLTKMYLVISKDYVGIEAEAASRSDCMKQCADQMKEGKLIRMEDLQAEIMERLGPKLLRPEPHDPLADVVIPDGVEEESDE